MSDELKKLWRDETLALVERRVEVRASIGRFGWLMGFELVSSLAMVLFCGSFLADHLETPSLAVSAGVLFAAALAQLIATIVQAVKLQRVDYSAPVVVQQRELLALKVLRLRFMRVAFAVGLVCWVAFGIVAMAAIFGLELVDAFGWQWVAINVAVGALAVPLFWWVSSQRHWFVSLRDDLAGRSLVRALANLEVLVQLERDEG